MRPNIESRSELVWEEPLNVGVFILKELPIVDEVVLVNEFFVDWIREFATVELDVVLDGRERRG